MQAIKAGDVYFMKSPIKMKNPADEKRMSYLLTTCSARPAVVIRPPMWWDDFSTVTVLPALTDAKYAITFKMYDRFGNVSECDYPVTPHTPHSIHVSRLARYIGSLDPNELEELLYAFKWIHDPEMQATEPIPKCYEKVMDPHTIVPKARNRKVVAMPTIVVDEHNTLKIIGENGNELQTVKEASEPHVPETAIVNDYAYAEANTPEAAKETTTVDSSTAIGVNKFPQSIFREEDLQEVANRFDIDAAYYDSELAPKVRDWNCMRSGEVNAFTEKLNSLSVDKIYDIYRSMYPIDAHLFGPRLPNYVICRLLHLSVTETSALKQICTFLHDMTDDEYEKRMFKDKKTKSMPEKELQKEAKYVYGEGDIMKFYDNKQISEAISRLRPYLNPKGMVTMPESMYMDFVRVPTHVIKRAYTGKSFQRLYATVYAAAEKHLNEKGYRIC